MKCGNETCAEIGKSKCADCGLVSYCGQICQKAHWKAHKSFCKANRKDALTKGSTVTSSSISTPIPTQPQQQLQLQQKIQSPQIVIDPAVQKRLHAIKMKTQSSFQNSDFNGSVKNGLEALEVAKGLPEPVQSIESIQILLNLSTAYLNLGKVNEADGQSIYSVEIAEKAVLMRQNHPQSIDMLAATLTNRTFVLLNANRLEEAEKCGRRALKLVETIFPPHDPRFFKSLRSLGLVLARRDQLEECEKLLRQAYDVSSGVTGPANSDSQLVVDDLVQVMMRRNNGSTMEVEKFLKLNYHTMEDSCTDENHHLLGEAAAKVGSVMASQGNDKEADPYLVTALKIRQKTLSPYSHTVAMTLMALANIRENQGDVSETTENYLVQALDIFRYNSNNNNSNSNSNNTSGNDTTVIATENQNSTHILNAIAFIRRIRTKRDGHKNNNHDSKSSSPTIESNSSTNGTNNNDVQDELSALNDETKLKVDAMNKKSGAGASGLAGSAVTTSNTTSKNITTARVNTIKDLEAPYESPTKALDPNDGINRMKMSAYFFETAQYSTAEIVLQEAYEIFLRQHGPQHSNTLTAKQNLEIVKQNALNQLWHEVLLEEKEKLLQKSFSSMTMSSSSPSSSPTTPAAAAAAVTNGSMTKKTVTKDTTANSHSNNGSSSNSNSNSANNNEWNEINADIWKVADNTKNSQGSCSIC